MSNRGYVGIGIFEPKTSENVGTLLRSAHAFDADFTFTIGAKGLYRQSSNTTKSQRHVPHYEYRDFEEFERCLPVEHRLVAVETDGTPLSIIDHPERAVYLLGNESTGLPDWVLQKCGLHVSIAADFCLNVAVAGSIVLFDRSRKGCLEVKAS